MKRDNEPEHCTYRDCADWLIRGPYRSLVDETRTAGGIRLVRGTQPAGHYPDPPFDDYSVICTTMGRGAVQTDFGDGARCTQIAPGMIIVAPTGTACDYIKHTECQTLVIGLPRHLVNAISEQVTGRPAGHLGRCHQFFFDSAIEALCTRIWSEAAQNHPYGVLFADTAINAIAVALLARNDAQYRDTATPKPLSGERLRRVLAYIEENLSEDMTIAALAEMSHLSYFHFARLFKNATGFSPHRYVVRRRIERAKLLISEGRLTLAAIASTVGFSSQSHLSRHFKQIVGSTPAQYR